MTKILIIDGEDNFCQIVKETVQMNREYHVSVATDGKAGTRAARRQRPDLILLDIVTPEMNGLEVLRTLKEDDKTKPIPVIVLTAMGDEELLEKAVRTYCQNWIVKPVGMDALQSRIDAVLSPYRKDGGPAVVRGDNIGSDAKGSEESVGRRTRLGIRIGSELLLR